MRESRGGGLKLLDVEGPKMADFYRRTRVFLGNKMKTKKNKIEKRKKKRKVNK